MSNRRTNQLFRINPVLLHAIVTAALLALVMLIYSNNYKNSFQFDDETKIVNNPKAHSLRKALPDRPAGFLRSQRWVVDLTMAFNFRWSRLDVWSYHLINNLLHGINSALVYFFLLMLLRRYGASESLTAFRRNKGTQDAAGSFLDMAFRNEVMMYIFIAGASAVLFAVHAIQTQAVTYVVQRSELLATCFLLISLMLYVRFADEKAFTLKTAILCIASLISFILALGSKPYVVVFPAIILMYEFIIRAQGKLRGILPRLKYVAIPFAASTVMSIFNVTGMFHAQTKTGYEFAGFGLKTISPLKYLCTQFNVIITYLRLLIMPVRLNLDYDYSLSRSLLSFPTFISFIVLLSIGVTAMVIIRKHRLLSFFILWFFVTLAPTSSFIPIADVIYEHRLYLPSIAFCFIAVTLLLRIFRKSPAVAALLLIVVFTFQGIGTFKRNYVWRDGFTLWSDVVEKSPNKARGHNTLANEYFKKLIAAGSKEKKEYFRLAFKHSKEALRIDPNHAGSHNNIALLYLEMGEIEKAVEHLECAIEIKPSFAAAYYNIASAYLQLGKRQKGIATLRKGMVFNPDNAGLYLTLGFLYGHNRNGIEYGPGAELDKAEEAYEKAIELKPNYANAYFNLATLYQAKKDYGTAISCMEQFLRYGGNDPKALTARNAIRDWKARLEREEKK